MGRRRNGRVTPAQIRLLRRLRDHNQTIYLDKSATGVIHRMSGGAIVNAAVVERLIEKNLLEVIARDLSGDPMQFAPKEQN